MFLWLVLGVVVSHLGIVWHMTRESPSACPERMRSRAVGGGPFGKPGVPRRKVHSCRLSFSDETTQIATGQVTVHQSGTGATCEPSLSTGAGETSLLTGAV